ncbi:MAG: hypothetical protein DI570_02755 [Phenylobacterium zucineum]|nr:MAG: hypothetical protein DI570_02755 [Phenylobacterium zucineum]
MSFVSVDAWKRLTDEYEAAVALHDVARTAADEVEMTTPEETPEEKRSAETLEAVCHLEDRLLAVEAPSFDAALYQLKVFGLRHLSIDLDEEPLGSEGETKAPAFRRIYLALASAAG